MECGKWNKLRYKPRFTSQMRLINKVKMKENIALEKSEEFAVRIIKLYRYLCIEKKEYVLAKQILKSGTSIGANLAESECAISKKDFLSKIYIALKESAETLYWLRLLHRTDYINKKLFQSFYSDCEEIKKILQSSTKTISKQLRS